MILYLIRKKAADPKKVAKKAKKTKKKVSEACSADLDSIQENLQEDLNLSVQCLGTLENPDKPTSEPQANPNVDLSSEDLDKQIINQVAKASAELEHKQIDKTVKSVDNEGGNDFTPT